MNGVIYYIWRNRLLKDRELYTTEGESLNIIDYGTCDDTTCIINNAKIRIGDRILNGNIALHGKSSEWIEESRKERNTFNNVILHVTLDNDCEIIGKDNETVKQLQIECSKEFIDEYNTMERQQQRLPCAKVMSELQDVVLHSTLSRLMVERIEEKAIKIEELFNTCDKKWDDTLFKSITRSFGFGIQSLVFEGYANILNMQALGRHRDNPIQVEAIMFGQAGLLEEESIPQYYRESAYRSNHFKELVQEYRFLSRKFNLETMDYKAWGTSYSTPHLRIARLSALYYSQKISMSSIAKCDTVAEIHKLLDQYLCGYWYNHTCFGGTETCGNETLKPRHRDIIIINSIIPMLFIYGKRHKDSRLCNNAEDFLHTMKSEENSIIRRWKEEGVKIDCAADSQAFLQLNKRYCSTCNCKSCHFAYHYMKSRFTRQYMDN